MTQEDKKLLLKDLCARLPYGVVCADKYVDEKFINKWNVFAIDATFGDEFSQVCISNCEVTYGYKTSITNIKPYLFPLSSMTEEQMFDFATVQAENCKGSYPTLSECSAIINWGYKHHFDVNNLIEKGLAIDATGKGIY